MAMSFEEGLLAICKEILPRAADFPSYNEDAEKIRNYLIEKMKDRDEAFKKTFNGYSFSETNKHHWSTELPDEFDHYLKFLMPFPITPQEVPTCPSSIVLTIPSGIAHPLVRQHCISRECLQDWLRKILLFIIEDGLKLSINGRKYLIEYPSYGRGYGSVHTILAKELLYGKREISFDLIPCFEFAGSAWPWKTKPISADSLWIAVPYGKRLRNDKDRSNEFLFMACTSDWERKSFHDKPNLRNSLRLLKVIRDVKNLELLTNYMLKSICLEEIEVRPPKFWEQPMGVILIEMLEVLIHALHHNYLPFFLDKRFKQLGLLRKELCRMYPIQLNLILKNLRHFQKQAHINYADVTVFSYARSNCKQRKSRFFK